MFNSKELLDFWFHSFKDKWFNPDSKSDQLASDLYIKISNNIEKFIDNNDIDTAKGTLSLIIVYDQLYRHYRRVNKLTDRDEIEKDIYNQLIIQWVKDGLDRGDLDQLTPEEKCFYLMPFRHSRQLYYLTKAIDLIKSQTELHPIYERFLKASYQQYLILLEQENWNLTYESAKHPIEPTFQGTVVSVIDTSRLTFWSKITWRWLGELYIYAPKIDYDNQIYHSVRQHIITNNYNKVAISLSGGVDSMLLAWLLKNFQQEGLIEELVAIHINYGNRKQANLEEEFVNRWCFYLEIPLYIRRITEISRGHNGDNIVNRQHYDRQLYEQYTRRVRFGFYQQFNCPVFLGHNRDDCFENILTNIGKQQHFENLFGMQITSQDLFNVTIVRPFLKINKSDIIATANAFELYHTLNSTPIWSTRYKIRHHLMKTFEDHFPSFLTGLEKLSYQLIELNNQQNLQVEEILSNLKILRSDCNSKVKIIINQKPTFTLQVWQKILVELCHKFGKSAPSHKAIQSCYQRLRHINQWRNNGKIHLKQDCWVICQDDNLSINIIQ